MPIVPCGLSVFVSHSPPKSNGLLLAIITTWILNLSAALAGTGDVILTCDPNSEPDLEGYGIYFSKDVDGPPYDLYGYIEIQELVDPGQPTFTVAGLEQERRYYITLTAYDSRGNESGYALSACTEINESVSECSEPPTTVEGGHASQAPAELEPSIGSSSPSRVSSSSAGFSAGCFIHAITGTSRLMGIVQLVSLVSLAALIRWAWRWRSAC
jgi:hypothetical protein